MDYDEEVQFFFQLFSFLIKTKVIQNVNRMLEGQKDMSKDRLTDRQTERQNHFSA